MELPGVMGEWTFKDLVAHLTGWRRRTVARIRAGCGGKLIDALPWPSEMGGDSDTEPDPDPINQYLYEASRSQPVREVLRESNIVLDELDAALTDLPEADFQNASCFSWLEGKALGDADLFGHFHDEHESDVYRWLNQQQKEQQSQVGEMY